ncbi:MAG: hypothetical protein IT328_21435 [Caldilineaceae bacterium]|nr:hypothetical protein [Caldilineaceae bacterium]
MRSFPQFPIRLARLERYLVPSALLYLALPYVIFCVGWLQWYWAALAFLLLVAALVESTRLTIHQTTASAPAAEASPLFTFLHLLFLLLIALMWLILVGVGEIGYIRGDWVKHESVLKDLIEHEWPVLYDFYADPVPLVYYFAYYLPSALVGKIAGWAMAQYVVFVWTFLGVVLAMLWFWVLARKASSIAVAQAAYSLIFIFIFFSGLDLIGNIIANRVGWANGNWGRLERWGGAFEYSANTILLAWVPNQALAGWIAGALTLYAILYIRHRRISWLAVGLSALWSPFVTMGLVPYLIAEFFSDDGPWLMRLRRYFSWSNLCGLAFALLIGLFYLSKLYESSPYARADIPYGFFLTAGSDRMLNDIGLYVTFWLLEVGIYAVLLFRGMKYEGRIWRWLFATTLVTLALLPLYRVGIYNDLVMRASIPALFCLAVLVGRAVHRSNGGQPTRVALIVVLLLGAATAVAELHFHISGMYREARGVPQEEPVESLGIVELYEGMPDFLLQYTGGYESPFFQQFAKKQAWVSRAGKKEYIAFSDNRILFESYEIEKDSGLQPGEEVKMVSRLHVFFRAIHKNYNISVRLVAEDGREVWREQGWPENRPTSIWAPTVLWFDTRTVTIPPETPAGIYRFDLSFVDPETHDLLPATAMPAGEYIGEMVPIGYVTVGEVEGKPVHTFSDPAQLDGKVALVGMTPAPEQASSLVASRGETLNIELFWQALAEMDRDYTGFVHVLDADGQLVAQDDHPPRNGFLPTSIWRDGLVVSDGYTILVPQDAPPGKYSLVAGMYDLESGARLPVWQRGEITGDSTLLMGVDVR